ncbi:MarR family transcriptional regulator [Actinomycetaceae bacterium L2_0104]
MNDVATGAQDVTPDLRNLMHNACRSLRRTWSAQLEPWNLTPFQWRALRAIFSRGGSLRPGEIAERLRIAPRSATEVIDQLEEKGLVERGRDPEDRRATQVRLTPSGVETTENILAERQIHSEQYFAPLSPAEQDELARLLFKLSEGVDHV